MLLSIIVPVYNIEKYVATCLESILAQDLDTSQYEILVIDDGSTDNSQTLARAFEKDHAHLTVYHQANVGLGGARKTGLRYAKGKYLYFLDGDDYLARNTLSLLTSTMQALDLDILGFDTLVTHSLEQKTSRYAPHKSFEPMIQTGIDFLGESKDYRVEVWWYFVKRSFLAKTGLSFEDKRYVNDSYFTPSLFIKAQRVAFLPLDVYRYVQRPGSTTSKKSSSHYERHINDTVYAIFKMQDIITDLPLEATAAKRTVSIKQESYVFFSIVRFMKSELKFDFLRNLLDQYKTIRAYPMKNMGQGRPYQNITFSILIAIFNRAYLLYPTLTIARAVFKFQRK